MTSKSDTHGKPACARKEPRELYLDLLKKCLTFSLWGAKDGSNHPHEFPSLKERVKRFLKGSAPARPGREQLRAEAQDWPLMAHTMIGSKRLDNLQFCVEDVIDKKVPEDLIETGVWRGGASIFMRAVLAAGGVTDRLVWVADSFEGLPPPDAGKYPADAGDILYTYKTLADSIEEVRANFEAYGMLDHQVRFLKGWFRDTLPTAAIGKLAVIRLDGDLYESTMDGFVNLYPRLSVGGYIIIDDFGAIAGCKKAVLDFPEAHGITESIREIDWDGVFWQRSA